MLVLNRRPGNAILIEGDIRVVVLSCDPRCVRIGIEAPSDVRILREEIAPAREHPPVTDPQPASARADGRRVAS